MSKVCSSCKSNESSKATYCSSCGSLLDQKPIAEDTTSTKKSHWIVLGVVLLVLVSTIFEEKSVNDASNSSADKIGAWVVTKQFVKDSLKSPSSADFGSFFSDYQNSDDTVTYLGNQKYRIKAWVDAQNAFGAKIRTYFICEVEDVGNDQWKLKSLKFLK